MSYEIGHFSESSAREQTSCSSRDSVQAAERFLQRHNCKFEHFGLKNTSMAKTMELVKHLKQKPDYICQQLDGGDFLLEVKVCGKYGLKIKLRFIDTFRHWKQKIPVMIFVYNGSARKIALLTFGMLLELVRGLEVHKRDYGKQFYLISRRAINWQTLE